MTRTKAGALGKDMVDDADPMGGEEGVDGDGENTGTGRGLKNGMSIGGEGEG